MSRKSPQPDAGGKGRTKKGKGKGKKGAAAEGTYTEVVVEEPGVPFGLVVLIAIVLSLPALAGFMDGTVEFRPAIVRLLGSLLVSWLMCQLVHSVVKSFGSAEHTTVIDRRAGASPTDPGQEGFDPRGRAAS